MLAPDTRPNNALRSLITHLSGYHNPHVGLHFLCDPLVFFVFLGGVPFANLDFLYRHLTGAGFLSFIRTKRP